MKKAKRFDFGQLGAPIRRHDGTVRLDSRLTRSGIFLYRLPNGQIRREYRPPDEVFKADSLESLHMVPVTMNHPQTGVDANNARRHTVGSVGQDVREDGEFVRGTIAVNDARSIKSMEAGKDQLSCGYECVVEMTPGVTPDGQRFDAVQRNIVYDHVAIVDVGRAGPQVRARMDAAIAEGFDDVAVQSDEEKQDGECDSLPSQTSPEGRGENRMKFTVKIDGVEFSLEGDASAKQAIDKHFAGVEAIKADADASVAEAEEKVKSAKADADTAQAKADALQADLDKLTAEKKADADNLPELVRARVKLEKEAGTVLETVKADATDAEIRKEVAAKAYPDVELEGKSDAYVECLFDRAVEKAAKSKQDKADADQKRKDAADVGAGAGKKDSDDGKNENPREAYEARMNDLANQPLQARHDEASNSLKVSK